MRGAVWINRALQWIEETAEQALGTDDRTLGDDFVRRRETRVNAEGFVDGAFAAQPFPALWARGDREAAGHVHAHALAALRFDLPVQ